MNQKFWEFWVLNLQKLKNLLYSFLLSVVRGPRTRGSLSLPLVDSLEQHICIWVKRVDLIEQPCVSRSRSCLEDAKDHLVTTAACWVSFAQKRRIWVIRKLFLDSPRTCNYSAFIQRVWSSNGAWMISRPQQKQMIGDSEKYSWG